MSNLKELSLENFSNGAAKELFEYELQKVLANIEDINTKPDAVRELTLKFTIKPDSHKEVAQLSVTAKSKLAAVNSASGQTFFGKTNGKLKAYAQNINQMELNVDEKPKVISNDQKQKEVGL